MLYIENNSCDPYFNFATEYYIMHEKDTTDDFFMFWRTTPTLMIGRNQNTSAEINEEHVKEKNINVVRRISGGGTIYTDLNGWQFSFITKGADSKKIEFETFTKPILNALNDLGVPAEFNNRNDLLIRGKKFSGNAQCSIETCKLHHGSLLFDTDISELVRSLTVADDKLIAKGIKSVRQRVTNIKEHMQDSPNKDLDSLGFRDLMLEYLQKDMDGKYDLTDDELKRINEIADDFRSWEWNYGNSPEFERVKSNRFAGGKLEVHLNVDKGRIKNCKMYGDFFTTGDVSVLESALVGCMHKEDEVRKALSTVGGENFFYMITLDEIVSCVI